MNNSQQRFFLAIRHKPSGGFLPNVKGWGFTRTQPSLTEPPRLFAKMGPLKQALDNWLQGEQFEVDAFEDDSVTRIRVVPRPERRAKDMEVVEIELIVRSLSEAELRRL